VPGLNSTVILASASLPGPLHASASARSVTFFEPSALNKVR
jgi:hypothetical protein